MTRIRQICWVLSVSLLLMVPVGRLMAHAELLAAVPAPGENLSKQPEELRLTFSEAVGSGSSITLFGEGFREIEGTAASVDGERPEELVTAVPELDPGVYSVQWVVISVDGHPASGSYTFGVLPEAENGLPVVFVGGLIAALLGAGFWVIWRKGAKRNN